MLFVIILEDACVREVIRHEFADECRCRQRIVLDLVCVVDVVTTVQAVDSFIPFRRINKGSVVCDNPQDRTALLDLVVVVQSCFEISRYVLICDVLAPA